MVNELVGRGRLHLAVQDEAPAIAPALHDLHRLELGVAGVMDRANPVDMAFLGTRILDEPFEIFGFDHAKTGSGCASGLCGSFSAPRMPRFISMMEGFLHSNFSIR